MKTVLAGWSSLCAVCTLVGCSGNGLVAVVGYEGDAAVKRDDDGGADDGDGGSSDLLEALIERERVAVEIVTIACAGACADVLAVGKGGSPPYAFEWEDGSADPARHLCPNATTSYSVTVTDRADSSLELSKPQQTATASVTAEVLHCPDDGEPGTGDLCVTNPSFEGTAMGAVSTAAPWISCGTFPTDNNNIWNDAPYGGQAGTLVPTDGSTYLHSSNNSGVGMQGASQALCAPLQAKSSHSFLIDLASPEHRNEFSGEVASVPSQLQVWGANAGCAKGELLWTSPTLNSSWKTFCVTLTPTGDVNHITLVPHAASGSAAWLAIDHLVPVEGCPP